MSPTKLRSRKIPKYSDAYSSKKAIPKDVILKSHKS